MDMGKAKVGKTIKFEQKTLKKKGNERKEKRMY